MAGRAAPIAIVPSVERGCRLRRRRESPRSGAPAVSDRSALVQCARLPGARQRLRPDAENFGGEVSFWTSLTSFDHLVGRGLQHRWHGEAEQSGRLAIDYQLELTGLHDRQVGRLGAVKDATDIGANLPERIRKVRSIAHESTNVGKLPL